MSDDKQVLHNFSAGHRADRPESAPDHSIYQSHDTGERHRYMNGQWVLVDSLHDVEPEVMAAPTQEELDAAELARVNTAAAAVAKSGEGDAGQPAPTPPAKAVKKKAG